VLAHSCGLHLPFVACSVGLLGASGAAFVLLPETLHEASAREERRRREAARRRDAGKGSGASDGGGWTADGGDAGGGGEASGATADGASPSAEAEGAASGAGATSAFDLMARPTLQGIFPVTFVNGFSQGASAQTTA